MIRNYIYFFIILFILSNCGQKKEVVIVHDSKIINCYWDVPLDCYACEYVYSDAVVIKCQ